MVYGKFVRDTTAHVIGKCPVKTCKKRKRLTMPGRVVADRLRTWTEWGLDIAGHIRYPTPSSPDIRPSTYPTPFCNTWDKQWMALILEMDLVCTEHDRFLSWSVIKGTFNADKTCNARCVNATGFNCECSCSGKQHGLAHA